MGGQHQNVEWLAGPTRHADSLSARPVCVRASIGSTSYGLPQRQASEPVRARFRPVDRKRVYLRSKNVGPQVHAFRVGNSTKRINFANRTHWPLSGGCHDLGYGRPATSLGMLSKKNATDPVD